MVLLYGGKENLSAWFAQYLSDFWYWVVWNDLSLFHKTLLVKLWYGSRDLGTDVWKLKWKYCVRGEWGTKLGIHLPLKMYFYIHSCVTIDSIEFPWLGFVLFFEPQQVLKYIGSFSNLGKSCADHPVRSFWI